MKKMLLSLVLAVIMITPAFAEFQPASSERDYIPQPSTHSPMRRDVLNRLSYRHFSGFNTGFDFWEGDYPFEAKDVTNGVENKATLYYTTNVYSDGFWQTIDIGICYLNWMSTVKPTGVVTMDLVDTSYAWPDIKSDETYYGYAYNNTGDVVTGTVNWYDVIDLA